MSTRFFVPCITSYHYRRTSALSFARRRQTIDAGTSFFSVSASISRFVPSARIKAGPDSDEKRCTEGRRASLSNIVFSKREELTTNARYLPFRRQYSIFFAIFSLIKVWFRLKNHFFSSDFPVSKTSFRLFSRHWALIYPTAAGKLTTKPRGRAFRRQFLLLFRKGNKLEAFPEYL